MLKKILLYTSICLLFESQAFSQTPPYYHYTSAEGLASSTVFSILQDKSGFIWFATLNGLSKFDGNHFTTFRTNDGLNSNSVTSIAEGDNGELFIGTYENGINLLRNGRIENYCSEIEGKSFATSYLLLAPVDNDIRKLYAYRSWGIINVINLSAPDRKSVSQVSKYPDHIIKLEKLKQGGVIALTTNSLCKLDNNKLIKINIIGLPDVNYNCLSNSKDDSYFIGTNGMIFKISNNSVVHRYEINSSPDSNDVTAIFTDKNENIWFSVMNRGFFMIPRGTDKVIDIGSKTDLQNTLVNYYMEDKEGNIWISTFGKGVYCLNNLYIKSYSEKDGLSNDNIYSMALEKSGRLLIGTFNGVNILENEKFDQVKSNSGRTLTDYIYEIRNYNNKFYVCGTFGLSEMIPGSYKGLDIFMFSAPSFCKTRDGLYLFGSGANLITVHKNLPMKGQKPYSFSVFGDTSEINRINEIFEDSSKNIWAGTTLGLCRISNLSGTSGPAGWKKTFFVSDPVLSSKINSIMQADNGIVWIAAEKGIARYDSGNDSIISYTNINGYDLSSSTSIVSDSKDRIWVGNMKGLYVLDGGESRHLDRQTGLPSDEVLSLCSDPVKDLIYIGTSNGISILDIKLFDGFHTPAPDLKILAIKAGDSVYSSHENLIFEHRQNHVNIDFKALCYSSPHSVRYKYQLNGEWAETDYDFLDLVSLSSGKFELQLMAKSQNTDWGTPCYVNFEVKPLVTETIWFKLCIILLFVAISISLVIWRLKVNHNKIKKEMELNARINELKHQALSAMMNPHFIFNSLNSVQYLINSDRNEEANDYIAIMAKLVRKNLDSAGKGFILLSEEISRLCLYLDLEKLRLEDRFSYEIITGTSVQVHSVMIPNMIIQPFVENTLWHGIIDSGKKGLLTISFSFEDIDIDSIITQSLIIRITDNGIGINAARKNRKEDHISKGIMIIEERLRLLSAKLHFPQPIMVEDLSNRNDSTQGTEVIISLPPQLYMLSSPE